MGRSSVAQDGALCYKEASERRVRLKKLGAVNGKDVNASGSRDVIGEAAGILRADILVCISEEVRNVGCGRGKFFIF